MTDPTKGHVRWRKADSILSWARHRIATDQLAIRVTWPKSYQRASADRNQVLKVLNATWSVPGDKPGETCVAMAMDKHATSVEGWLARARDVKHTTMELIRDRDRVPRFTWHAEWRAMVSNLPATKNPWVKYSGEFHDRVCRPGVLWTGSAKDEARAFSRGTAWRKMKAQQTAEGDVVRELWTDNEASSLVKAEKYMSAFRAALDLMALSRRRWALRWALGQIGGPVNNVTREMEYYLADRYRDVRRPESQELMGILKNARAGEQVWGEGRRLKLGRLVKMACDECRNPRQGTPLIAKCLDLLYEQGYRRFAHEKWPNVCPNPPGELPLVPEEVPEQDFPQVMEMPLVVMEVPIA